MSREARLFSALLRHWRTRRGYSQLDLALAAGVSPRHLSFLETGRSQPSREMVLRLAAMLEVPLRDQNALLRAADLPAEFAEPTLSDGLPLAVVDTIDRMMQQHEPFPMVVLDQRYDVLRRNDGARRAFDAIVLDPLAMPTPPNLLRVLFDPRLARSSIADWERTARTLLSRAYRESLSRPSDHQLAALVAALLEYPDVPASFRQPDFSTPTDPVLSLRVRRGNLELEFVVAVTRFSAPHDVMLDELRIESYFPRDAATAEACARGYQVR